MNDVENIQTSADIATWPVGSDIIVVLGNSAHGAEGMPLACFRSVRLGGLFLGNDRWHIYWVATTTDELGAVMSCLHAKQEVRGIVLADELQAAARMLCLEVDSVSDACEVVDTLSRSRLGWLGYCTAGTGVLDALQSVRNRDISGSDVILIGESALGRCVAVECLRRLCRALLIVDPRGTGQVFAERLCTKYNATPIQLVAEPTAAAVLAPDAMIIIVDPMFTESQSPSPTFAATEWAKGRDCYVVFGESDGRTLPWSLNEEGVSLGKVLMHTPHRFTRMLELLEKTPEALARNAQNAQGFAVLERAMIGGATDSISASAGEPPRKRRTALIAWSLAVAICIGLFFIMVRFRVTGASMEPALRNGDYVLALNTKVPLCDPQRGDIVIFAKKGEEVDYVKRVIGLPGEFVQIHDGRVWIDAKTIAEPYAQGATASDFVQVKLGPEEYFLLGDHRTLSRDSRNLGPVRRSEIRARAVLVCWPWSRWHRFEVLSTFF